MEPDRSWMYTRTKDGEILPSFVEGVDAFIAFALAHPDCMICGDMKCPCNAEECRNRNWLKPTTVVQHLKSNGFVPKYEVWTLHGEYVPLHDYGRWRKCLRTKYKDDKWANTRSEYTSSDVERSIALRRDSGDKLTLDEENEISSDVNPLTSKEETHGSGTLGHSIATPSVTSTATSGTRINQRLAKLRAENAELRRVLDIVARQMERQELVLKKILEKVDIGEDPFQGGKSSSS